MTNQHWYTYIFVVMFCLAFIGLYIKSTLAFTIQSIIYNIVLMSCLFGLIYWNWV